MQIGIDLGTSNCSVASYAGGRPRIFRTPEGTEVMPSVIYVDRRGNRTVGVRAYDQAIMAPENVAQGFKRLMGTATPLRFAASGQEMLPEAASAELLRTLVGYALVEADQSAVDGTVVTIPAAFNQLQSEATLAAAGQAGLDRVALLQEPVAAAMAAMAGSDNRDGQFLIYDLGGGTFDLALVQAAGGTVNIVAHEGVNMLGGRDFDRLILDQLVRPWLTHTFKLPADFATDRRYDRLLRVARLAAERAKMELSARHETAISASDDLVRLEDDRGEPIYLDVPITRIQLDALIEPLVARTVALSQAIVETAGYALSDINRVVLIGGPTKMPLIRARIGAALGIAVEDPQRVDPMTAVAAGAAIYADSRDWSGTASVAKPRKAVAEAGTTISVGYEHDVRAAGAVARLRIVRLAGPSGLTVQVESTLGWSSGRLPLDTPADLQLPLPDMGPNQFRAIVFDPAGRPVADAGREWGIERAPAASAGIPASQTIGVKVQDDAGRNTIVALVPKGALLPLSGTATFRAAQLLRPGSRGQLRLELFQVSDLAVLDPVLNLHIGEFRIRGSDLPEGMAVRRGTELRVHWAMNEGQTLEAEVEIPDLAQTFDTANFYDWQTGLHSFEGEDGDRLTTEMLDTAEEDLDRAGKILPLPSRAPLAALRARLDAARLATKANSDPDARRGAAEEARLVRQAVAITCSSPDVRAAILRRDLNDQMRFFDRDVRPSAPAAVAARADQMAVSARAELEPGTADGFDVADTLIREINGLYWNEGLRQPGFCAMYWRWVRVERHLMRDKERFDAERDIGDRQLAAGHMEGLSASLSAMWRNKISESRRGNVARPADVLRE